MLHLVYEFGPYNRAYRLACLLQILREQDYTVIHSINYQELDISVTSIRLQPEVEKSLNEVSEKLQRSRNWIINQAIREYLSKESVEDARWQETLEALDSLNQGKLIESGSVHTWLESWGSETELPKPKK